MHIFKKIIFLNCLLLILTSLSFSLFSKEDSDQGSKLIMGTQNKDKNNFKFIDSDILLYQYENYDSYRPDSFSDATKNPFGPKRFKVEDFIKQINKN